MRIRLAITFLSRHPGLFLFFLQVVHADLLMVVRVLLLHIDRGIDLTVVLNAGRPDCLLLRDRVGCDATCVRLNVLFDLGQTKICAGEMVIHGLRKLILGRSMAESTFLGAPSGALPGAPQRTA